MQFFGRYHSAAVLRAECRRTYCRRSRLDLAKQYVRPLCPGASTPSISRTRCSILNIQFRALEPLLKNSAYRADSRVIWSSSLEASARFYDSADWQLTKTDHSYESVKYQIELIATTLDRIALRDSSSPKSIRHFVSHPGVASTKISTNLVAFGGFLDTLKVWVFYVVRRRFFFCLPFAGSEQS
jgi:hypothetical protein